FEQLVQRYRHVVYGLCLRMLRHHEDAEDATQETFTRLSKHVHRWDSSRPFEPWLMTIAGNRCRTMLAKRAKRQTVPLSSVQAVATEEDSRQRAAGLLQEELDIALADLRDDHRRAFELFHQEGLDYQSIADRMECPVGTVKTWVHRARTRLIQRLQRRQVIHRAKSQMANESGNQRRHA
ncbi:MAG: sigma-70 family RNA polymerase sigma factor, partial [Planctomycetota bacterium]